jgi:hypothetical protein
VGKSSCRIYAARAVDGNVIDRARFPAIGRSPAAEIEAGIGGAIRESVTVIARSPALDRAKSREEQKAAEASARRACCRCAWTFRGPACPIRSSRRSSWIR